jgi:cytochrome c
MSLRPFVMLPITLAALALLPAAAPQNGAGAVLYKQRCQACHTLGPGAGSLGPSLMGVIGRKAGSSDFRYSPALKAANVTWSRSNLDRYLAGPGKMIPGTRMVVTVSDAGQRAELIGFLASTHQEF